MLYRGLLFLSFRAPLPVISSEARNLGLGEKISQSQPLTSFEARSFEMTRGSLPLTFVRRRSFEMTRGGISSCPFLLYRGFPFLSFRPFSTMSFRAPFSVISSEARNLILEAKISQSQPLTFVRGRSFEMTRVGRLPSRSFGVSSFEMTRGAYALPYMRGRAPSK